MAVIENDMKIKNERLNSFTVTNSFSVLHELAYRQVGQLNKDWRQIVSGLTFGGSFRSRGEVKNHFDFNSGNQERIRCRLAGTL